MNKFFRPTFAEINLKNLESNIENIKRKLKKGVKLLIVVKADAYGHGAVEVSRYIEDKTDYFGVALFEEAIELRKKGIKKPILVMGSVYPLKNFKLCFKYNITPTVASLPSAEYLSKIASKFKKKQKIHIKIDTGMGRIGINIKRAYENIKKILSLKNIIVEGVFSHLAQADRISYFTIKQIELFGALKRKLKKEGINIPLWHIANSVAILKYRDSHFDMVRPGISVYGLMPFRYAFKVIELKPVMTFKTKIVFLKEVEKHTSISYGRTWFARRKSIIATIPVGYADGYNRLLSNNAFVLIRGKRVPVVGRVCMDMTMLDVTDIKNPKIGEEVILWGKDNNSFLSVEEIAKRINSINYEVVTSLSKRVPRIYIR